MDGAERMSQLIRDLLEYSRVDRVGKQPRPTDSEPAFSAALANLRNAITEAGSEVTHDPLPLVMADQSQLTQLLQNLIGNAIKFRSPGRPCKVHVGARRSDGQCVFSVEDNGIGIPKEGLDRIFVIFQRLHDRSKYPGTGIGLAICKKIVERNGGRIWVEAQPGQGSTFFFSLQKA